MENIFYCRLPLPGRVRGASVKTPDGDYFVIINENLNDTVQQAATKHELEHFKLDHFFSEKDVADVECEAQRKYV